MSAVESIAVPCNCVTFDTERESDDVRFCANHHRYHRGAKRLYSVTQVIRETWPIKKNFEAADPAVLEHARDRGVRVDAYFSEWLRSGKVRISAGEWREVVERLEAVIEWWSGFKEGTARPQVVLADDEIAGACDWIAGAGFIYDMKNVSALDPTYLIQIGAYADLYATQEGEPCVGGALVHVTQPKDKPASVKAVKVDLPQAIADWRTLRATWSMVQRLTAKGAMQDIHAGRLL